MFLILFGIVLSQTQLEFPYCWTEYLGELTSTEILLEESVVGYSFECELACIQNLQCMTYSFSYDGTCKLYQAGYYEAMKNLEPNNLILTKVGFRCEFECARRSVANCEDVSPCKLVGQNCLASCDEFSGENVLVDQCDLSVQTVQCGGQKDPCSNSSLVGAENANLVCIGDQACDSIQVTNMNNVQCNGCVGSLFDDVNSLTGDSMQNCDLVNVESVICRGCSFTNSNVLQVQSMEVPTNAGLTDVHSQIQAEIQELKCSATGACADVNINVNKLTCDGQTGPNACSSSEFYALGEETEVWCLGQNSCDGSAFQNFDRVYCIGANSCENTLFVNIGQTFCYLHDEDTQVCNSALSNDYFKNCIEWTGEECITRAPSFAPTLSQPTAQPSQNPSASPSTIPSISPSLSPTIFIAVEAATRSCQVNEWFDMHRQACSVCPDGTEPTHTKLDCATCSASTAGKGGTCEECAKYFYFPSNDATECQSNVVLVIVFVAATFSCLLSCYLWRCKEPAVAPEPKRQPKKEDKKKTKDEKSKKKGKDNSKGNKPEKKKQRRNSMEKRKDSDTKSRRKSIEKRTRKNSDSVKQLDVDRAITAGQERSSFRRTSLRKDPGQAKRRSLSRSEGVPPPRKRSMSTVRQESAGWENWTPLQVAKFFESQGMPEIANAFRKAEVYGSDLQELAYDDLCDLGFRTDEIKRFDGLMNVLSGTSCV